MRDPFVLRLIAFYTAQFVVIGIQIPFFPVWLDARGFDARAIGLVLAASRIAPVLVIPVATRLADRFGAVRGTLIATVAVAIVAYAAAALADGLILIAAAAVIGSVAFSMTFPLGDAYSLRALAERGRSYGSVRMWGSAAFIAANVAGGVILGLIAPASLIWLLLGTYGATLVAAIGLARPSADVTSHPTEATVHGPLWKSPAFIAVALASALIQSSHAVFYGFSALDWAAQGLSGTTIGLLWAIGVTAEIGLFAWSGRLPRAIGPAELVCIGAGGAVLRWLLLMVELPHIALPFVQCLHGLSFAATHLGTMQLITRIAPRHMAATAQGDVSALGGVVMGLSLSLAGVLFQAVGSVAYAAMAIVAALGGIAAIAHLRIARSATKS
jgi:PPP family 3-phenylpropionic acid transporter